MLILQNILSWAVPKQGKGMVGEGMPLEVDKCRVEEGR